LSKKSSYLHNMRHNLRRKAEYTHFGAERTSLTKVMDAARSEEERQRRDKEETDRAKPSQVQEEAKISCAIAHTATDAARTDEDGHRQAHYHDDGPRPTMPPYLQQHVAHISLAGMPYEAKVKAAAECFSDLLQRGVLREHNLCFSCGGDHKKMYCNRRSAFLAHFGVNGNDLQRHIKRTC
jgi:hypothetical protein